METATQAVLAADGLPADYQIVPILYWRNTASEQSADQSLQMLDDIYQRAASSAGSYLTPDDLTKFQEFRTAVINNYRAELSLSRNLLAPMSD
jgi:hypothetical protein